MRRIFDFSIICVSDIMIHYITETGTGIPTKNISKPDLNCLLLRTKYHHNIIHSLRRRNLTKYILFLFNLKKTQIYLVLFWPKIILINIIMKNSELTSMI